MEIRFITHEGKNRSGWIFQQLIKLSGRLGQNRFYAVIDADHILLRPHTFLTPDYKTVFYRSPEYVVPYHRAIHRLTGRKKGGFFQLSYVAHKMLFDKDKLQRLHGIIEGHTGKPWDRAIIESLDPSVTSPFSEFETYGLSVCSAEKTSMPWSNKTLPYTALDSLDNLIAQYGKKYASVTFPSWG